MSSEFAVRLDDVSKSFRSYRKPQDRFWQGFFRNRKMVVDHDVLKKIDLNIVRGKTVGLVGVNGAGKSTLLALICGIYEPTCGHIETNGQVGALLDLGAGFNSELTGRENLYLVASIRGFSRSYVTDQLAKILDFAGIGEAIDQPVKIYSTGMYMRLAFSLVVHLKPDTLVIDEALAVGDEAFQSKCYQKLRQLSDDGVTIIFVSHASHLILQLCDEAVLLDHGEILVQGEPRHVVDLFHKLIYAPASEVANVRREIKRGRCSSDSKSAGSKSAGSKSADSRSADSKSADSKSADSKSADAKSAGLKSAGSKNVMETRLDASLFDPDLVQARATRFVTQGARILNPHITNADENQVNVLIQNQVYRFRFQVSFSKSIAAVRFGMLIKTISGFELGGRETSDQLQSVNANDSREICFEFRCQLASGIYFLNAGALGKVDDSEVFLDRLIDAVQFRVLPIESFQTGTIAFGIDATVTDAGEFENTIVLQSSGA